MTRLLILLAVAFVTVAAALGWMWRTYIPVATLADIYFGLTPVLKFLALVIIVLTGVGVIAGLKRNEERVQKAAILASALGVFGAVYGEFNTHFGMLIDNVINFTTLAPMRIESLAILALGLFGAVLGLVVLHLSGGVRRV